MPSQNADCILPLVTRKYYRTNNGPTMDHHGPSFEKVGPLATLRRCLNNWPWCAKEDRLWQRRGARVGVPFIRDPQSQLKVHRPALFSSEVFVLSGQKTHTVSIPRHIFSDVDLCCMVCATAAAWSRSTATSTRFCSIWTTDSFTMELHGTKSCLKSAAFHWKALEGWEPRDLPVGTRQNNPPKMCRWTSENKDDSVQSWPVPEVFL